LDTGLRRGRGGINQRLQCAAAVQKAVEPDAKGGTIVRWEKEGENYEAVIEKDGKQTGVEVTADGKVVSRHDESKEHKEKGEKGE
jgi:hypothetical protein